MIQTKLCCLSKWYLWSIIIIQFHFNVNRVFGQGFQRTATVDLICDRDKHYNNSFIHMKIIEHNLRGDCPCAYDYTGKCRYAPHMCTASSKTFLCDFRLDNIIITKKGGMVAYNINQSQFTIISMNHPTIKGSDPMYHPKNHDLWASKYIEYAGTGKSQIVLNAATANRLPVHKLVVPLRMLWDDVFTHLSFQALPLIGHVYTAYKDTIWNELSWHSSLFSAGLLALLDIPRHRIIIDDNILAKELALPWVQGWCPLQISGLPRAAKEVSDIIRQNLLKIVKQKYSASNSSKHGDIHLGSSYTIPLLGNDDHDDDDEEEEKEHSHSMNTRRHHDHKNLKTNHDNTTTSTATHHHKNKRKHYLRRNSTNAASGFGSGSRTKKTKRTIVYFTRSTTSDNGVREVVNEKSIIHYMQKYLSHDYEFVMAVHAKDEYSSIAELHQSWAKYAAVVSHAAVILGPHGGAFNNLMWAPDDVNIIEFNMFPDELIYNKQITAAVRSVFLTAAYSKGVDKYWIIDPSMRHQPDFYAGKMRIAVLDLMIVLKRIGVLRREYDPMKDATLSTERRETWTNIKGKTNLDYIPPPIK